MNHLLITGALLCVLSSTPSCSFPFWRSRLDPIPESSTDNVECFLDYMELWVPRRQMDGLLLWLSRVMRFPVSLSSLDRSNHLISRCRYALDMDSSGNFIFRVHYSACNVQTQNSFHVLEIHMVKKTSTGNGRSDRYLMRCPAVTAAMGREIVRCDPNYVQVFRPMPLENTNDQDWYIVFRGKLVVSVEDASLIGVEVEMNKSHVTVKGLRSQLLTSTEFLDRSMDVLPLWFGHGFYAYSLEASCPLVTQNPGEEIIIHIPKQRMGLVKRGPYISETLTLKNIVVGRPINVTVTENKHFVMVNIPAADILQSQECTTTDNKQGIQLFYSIDLVLEFTEIAYPMNWTLENCYECTALTPRTVQDETFSKNNEHVKLYVDKTVNYTVNQERNAMKKNGEYQLSQGLNKSRFIIPSSTVTSMKRKVASVKPPTSLTEGSGGHFDISGSGDYQYVSSGQIIATQLTDLGNMKQNSSNRYMTLPSSTPFEGKYLNILNVFPITSPLPQDNKISSHQLSNSTVIKRPKNIGVTSNMFSTLAPNESRRNNKTSSLTASDYKDQRLTMVKEYGESVNYSSVVKQEESTKPLNSQQLSNMKTPSSEEKPKDDADWCEVLIGDTLQELLDETMRDDLIYPVNRHNQSSGKRGSSERTKRKTVPITQGKTIDEISGPSLDQHEGPARDLQSLTRGPHMADDSVLSSHHIERSIFNSLHEDILYNTPSDIETIASAEHLIVEK